MTGNRNDVAKLLGLSPRQITNLVNDGILPATSDGSRKVYALPAVVAAFVKYRVEQEMEKSEPVDGWDAKARVDTLRAELLELELAEKRGELATVAQFDRQFAAACDRVASRLKALPNRLAPVVVGVTTVQDALARVESLVRETWEELYQADDVPQDVPAPSEAA